MSFRRYEDDRDFEGGGRWDRNRFERVRAKSRPRERDFRFEKDDRYGPRGMTREIDIDERIRGPRGRFEERDRFFEDDRYRPGRRFDFEEEDRYRSGKEIAPYMDRFEPQPPPPRPGVIRRRSSWNDFDRRPYQDRPRYAYEERERDHDPNNLKLQIRMGSPDKHEEPPKSVRGDRFDDRKSRYDDRRSHYDDRKSHYDDHDRHIDIDERDGDRRIKIDIDERDHDTPRYRREEPRGYYREPPRDYRENPYEDYNGARIIRERERIIDRRHDSPEREVVPPREVEREPEPVREREVEEHEYKYDLEEEELKKHRPAGAKRGKTRLPKRLVHRQALLDLNYPYEEEGEFYIARYALAKEHIDEIIKLSDSYIQTEKTTYSYEKEVPRAIEAPPSHEHEHEHEQQAAPAEEEFEETVVRKVIENPTEEEYERFRATGEYEEVNHGSDHGSDHGNSAAKSQRSKSRKRSKSRRRRSKSRHRGHRDSDYYKSERVEDYSDDDKVHGAIVLPTRKKDRDIDDEIKALERERRELKRERRREDRKGERRDERRSTGRRLELHRDDRSSSSSSDDREGSVRISRDRREIRRSGRSKSRKRSKSRSATQRRLDIAAATLT